MRTTLQRVDTLLLRMLPPDDIIITLFWHANKPVRLLKHPSTMGVIAETGENT
ncbi:hypothetical protein BDW75DRAFT_202949 [Aspergillus navahoensis]